MSDEVYVQMPPFFLNQSRWKSYQDCDRLYGWLNIENLVETRPRKPLVVGTGVHRAQVEIHAQGRTEEAIKRAAKNAYDFVYEAMKPTGPQLPNDEAERVELARGTQKIVEAYHRHYGSLAGGWKPLGMELDFTVEVGEGTGVFLVGTLDNLVTLQNALWIVDYKTMAKLDMREFLKYEIDIQITAYIYGGTKQLSLDAKKEGKPPVIIRGAIIDGIVKTKEPQFHREIYTRSVEDLREFELEFCQKAWEIAAKHAIIKGNREAYDLYCNKIYELGRSAGWKVTFPKNTQQCFRYGTCSHRDLCVKDNDTRRLAYGKRQPDYVDLKRKP